MRDVYTSVGYEQMVRGRGSDLARELIHVHSDIALIFRDDQKDTRALWLRFARNIGATSPAFDHALVQAIRAQDPSQASLHRIHHSMLTRRVWKRP